MPNPRISVITVCFNAAGSVEEAMKSVLSQTYFNVEYIVVDGSSTDGTRDIISQYQGKISKFVSEKDNGIYDAMNKGVALATGDIIYFLNADDIFCDNSVLADIAREFDKDKTRSLIYGRVLFKELPKNLLKTKQNFRFTRSDHFLTNSLCHQAVFAKRALFFQLGGFDTHYKYLADRDWLIKVFKYDPAGFVYIDRSIAYYHYFGRSYQKDEETAREKIKFVYQHFPIVIFCWYWFRYVFLRGLKKRLVRRESGS